ncbi:MAG: class I SAM-dependent methyltransferase [PVC group bacterium]
MKNLMAKLIETGVRAGDTDMYNEDEIWSRYSGDKVDIGEVLTAVIRSLCRAVPLSRRLRALSLGSGSEPQFRILEAAFRGGLYLLDIDRVPLGIVQERLRRQWISHVTTIRADYNRVLMEPVNARAFLKSRLAGKKMDLVALHHSLYYSEKGQWEGLFENLHRTILSPRGAIHAVMMASESADRRSTTWLYNHFAGKYFGCRNDQDLLEFGAQLRRNKIFKASQILSRTHEVRFFVDNFGKFMAVIWMILLYPDVHVYNRQQKEEITEYIYREFWLKKQPLVQFQDHLVVYKGLPFRGLI